MRWIVATGLALASTSPVLATETDTSTVPLRGLTSVGTLVVTAADDTVAETALRTAVEKRLAKVGITVDGLSAVNLIVNVAAERNRSDDGRCVFGRFIVSLALREPVSAERTPGEVFPATTWYVRGQVSRFGPGTPRQALMDILQDQLSTFLRARGVDDQTPTGKPEHP